MKPQLLEFGNSRSRVVVIDDFTGRVADIREMAAALAPFPPPVNAYPGIRRVIEDTDGPAFAYMESVLNEAAQFIGGAFDIDNFDWLEASFSMVTQAPESLEAKQRAPHFDSVDPKYLAVLHYLSDTPRTGTAFYRHRSTGIEQVTGETEQAFISMMKLESLHWKNDGYLLGSTGFFEQIGHVDALPDRLVLYQGCLLHSGIIPPDMTFSDDPLTGRLTANLFVQGR